MKEREEGPKLSKKGTMVTEVVRQAISMIAHSYLFFAKMPMNMNSSP